MRTPAKWFLARSRYPGPFAVVHRGVSRPECLNQTLARSGRSGTETGRNPVAVAARLVEAFAQVVETLAGLLGVEWKQHRELVAAHADRHVAVTTVRA